MSLLLKADRQVFQVYQENYTTVFYHEAVGFEHFFYALKTLKIFYIPLRTYLLFTTSLRNLIYIEKGRDKEKSTEVPTRGNALGKMRNYLSPSSGPVFEF